MRRVPLLLLLLLLTLSVHASAVADSPQNDKVAPTDPVVHIKLGESTVELAGPWKFHVGDDTAWAQPDFNDSSWEEVDLTPDGKTGLSSGWTARGHKGYSGFAWYRLQGRCHTISTTPTNYSSMDNGLGSSESSRTIMLPPTPQSPSTFACPETFATAK